MKREMEIGFVAESVYIRVQTHVLSGETVFSGLFASAEILFEQNNKKKIANERRKQIFCRLS